MSSSDHDEGRRVLRQAALLGEQNLNRLDKWRLCNARAEEERASERRAEDRQRERTQEREHNEIEVRAELRQAAIADVRGEIDQRHDIAIEAVGTVIAQHGDKLVDHSEELIKTVQRDLFALVERRFGELMGRLDVVLPEPRSRESKSFRFASERADSSDPDKVIDLPDWRRHKMN